MSPGWGMCGCIIGEWKGKDTEVAARTRTRSRSRSKAVYCRGDDERQYTVYRSDDERAIVHRHRNS